MKHGFVTRKYHNLRLQTKFTITHLVITTLPILLLFLFFYGKLYDMVLADTIRTEQTSSARTTPMIEGIVDQVLQTHQQLQNFSFYNQFHRQGFSSEAFPGKDDISLFHRQVSSLIDTELITDIRIYIDLPKDDPFFDIPGLSSVFLPMQSALGTYWNGIFKGRTNLRTLYCPSFYLSPEEIQKYGDLAYISRDTMRYNGDRKSVV